MKPSSTVPPMRNSTDDGYFFNLKKLEPPAMAFVTT
jgi:hypothetical protein